MNNSKPFVLKLLEKILQYQFIILALSLDIIGILFILYSKSFLSPDLATSFGIALITAGTVGLALEFYTRKQFQSLINRELNLVFHYNNL